MYLVPIVNNLTLDIFVKAFINIRCFYLITLITDFLIVHFLVYQELNKENILTQK